MTAATILATLPASGRFYVDTLHSTYDVDVDASTATRTPMHDDANELQHDDEAIPFDRITCNVGERMVIERLALGDDAGLFRTSTEVLGITPYEMNA